MLVTIFGGSGLGNILSFPLYDRKLTTTIPINNSPTACFARLLSVENAVTHPLTANLISVFCSTEVAFPAYKPGS
jgi:hypothetical protein